MYQVSMTIKARHMDFRAARIHPDRVELQRELDAIYAAGDVRVVGTLEDEGAGDEMILAVMVEQWAPVEKGS